MLIPCGGLRMEQVYGIKTIPMETGITLKDNHRIFLIVARSLLLL